MLLTFFEIKKFHANEDASDVIIVYPMINYIWFQASLFSSIFPFKSFIVGASMVIISQK
jgi:hypothetical protein